MKCLVIDEMHESITELFQKVGVVVDYRPEITKEEIITQISKYEGIVIRSKMVIDSFFLDKAINLKFIARAGAGLDQIEVDEVNKRGIHLVNAPEGNRDALAEHALGMLLGLLNNIYKSDHEIRSHIWNREGNRGYELSGKRVGLLGYGYMAGAFAKRLKAIGCTVLAYDKYKSDFSDEYVQEVTMERIFEESDVFSVHVPLTEETLWLIDGDYIKKFKKPIWLLNTARRKILKLQDLVPLLENNKVLGAALDVLENEKIQSFTEGEKQLFGKLTKKNNVILTPHVAGWSHESYYKINEVLAKKIAEIFPYH